MWSQFAAGGPPPPPPQAGGFAPPPPPPPQGGFPPPPPPQQEQQHEGEEYYESDNSDEGGLGMTVNMVTSAASMLFSAARPLANAGPAFAPPPPQETSSAPPAPPPAPIEQFASMLDDDDEDEGMTEIDVNETVVPEPSAAAAAPSEAAMVFDRPPTPTSEPPKAPPLPPGRGMLGGGPPPPSPKPHVGRLGFPPPSPKGFPPPAAGFSLPPPASPKPPPAAGFAPPPASPKPLPAAGFAPPPMSPMPVDAQEVFARPPTPTQQVVSQAPPPNPFARPPPTQQSNNVFAQAPPTPTGQNPFSRPPPATTTSASNVFAQPPTPTQQKDVFSQAPPTPSNPPPANPFSRPPPTPPTITQQQQYPPPATPNPPPQEAIFAPPPPTPQEELFSQPPPTPDSVFGKPPPNPPQAEIFSQPPSENSTANAAVAPSVFEKPPPVPNPSPPPQAEMFSQPPPTSENATVNAALAPVFEKPPPPQGDLFSQPPPPSENATTNAAVAPPVFEKPPPPQGDLFSQPTPPSDNITTNDAVAPPPVPDLPTQEELFSQPPPTPSDTMSSVAQPNITLEPKALETIDSAKSGDSPSKATPPLHRVTPPVSPGGSFEIKDSKGSSEGPPTNDAAMLTPLISNLKPSAGAAAAAVAAASSSSKKILLPPVASTSPARIQQRKLRGPPPRTSIPARPTRSRFKLPTPRKSRSRTPVRGSRSAASSATKATPTSASGRLPLPTPKGKEMLFPSPQAKVSPPKNAMEEKSTSDGASEAPATPVTTDVPTNTEPTTETAANTALSMPSIENSRVEQEEPQVKKEEIASPEETITGPPEATTVHSDVSLESMPEGWAEATDPTTQQIYYYNSVTGETVWERPTNPKQITIEEQTATVDDASKEDKIASELKSGGDIDSAFSESSPPAEEQEMPGSSMPEGWEEATDPNTQQVYYYNSITGETVWERPIKTETPATDDHQASAVETTGQEDIPPKEKLTSQMPAEEEKDNAEVPPPAETQAYSLPEGWEEVTDPSTQQVYYFNSISGDTVWERPTEEKPSVTEEISKASSEPEIAAEETDNEASSPEEEPANLANATSDTSPEENESSDLLEGWVEATDPNTQQIYYYNSATGETAWERPTREEPSTMEGGAPEPSDEPEIAVEQSENDESSPEDEPANSTAEETIRDASPVFEQEVPSMPEGWEEATDPTTQQVYFYNSMTGETVWERPTLPTASTTDSAPDQEPKDVTPELVVEETLETEVSPSEDQDEAPAGVPFEEEGRDATEPLPEDWTESFDPSSGQTYYYNSQSGETSWERPTDAAIENIEDANLKDDLAKEPEPEKTAQFDESLGDAVESENPEKEIEPTEHSDPTVDGQDDSNVLPDGWIEATDPVSGNLYFYHSESGTVSWERPQRGNEETNSEKDGDEYGEAIDLEPEVATNEDDSLDDEVPLPEGWIESFDPQTKNIYYYNSETGDVSWERPGVSPEGEEQMDETSQVEKLETSDDDIEPEIETQTETSDNKEPLPEGWIEDVDPKTEQVYFYNTFNGDVSWERPTSSPASGDTEEESPEKAESSTDIDPASEMEPELSNQAANTVDHLADEWEEVNDPSTGQNYFYNRSTGESSWERPAGIGREDKEENEVSEQNTDNSAPINEDEDEKSEDKFQASSSEVPSIDETLDALMADFGVEDDPNPTQADAINEEKENQVVESSYLAAEVDATIDDVDALPEGWVEELDESSGQNYYFNTISGETSWERPNSEADRSSTEIDKEDSTGKMEQDAETTGPDYTVNDLAEDTQDTGTEADKNIGIVEGQSLPDGWVEAADPSTGQTYYYNEITDETSWDRPGAVDVTEESAGEDLTEVQVNEEKVEHEATAEPIVQDEPKPAVETLYEGEPENIEATVQIEPGTDVSLALPPNWEQVEDPTNGTYYYNTVTGDTSWEKPTDGIEGEELQEEHSNAADIAIGDESVVSDVQDDADIDENDDDGGDDWVESTDPSSGEVYYYNTKTGETSWEKPSLPMNSGVLDENLSEDEGGGNNDQKELSTESTNADIVEPFVKEDSKPDSSCPSSLPDGWSEVLDATTGEVSYYQNSLTNAITFTKPVNVEEKTSDVATEDQTHAPVDENKHEEPCSDANDDGETIDALPEGWAEIEDPSSGQVYYYNSSTGESKWDKPTASDDGSDEIRDGNLQNADSDKVEDGEENEVNASEEIDSPQEGSIESEEIIDDLPNDWVESTDPSSGEKYYYNIVTEEVSWDFPKTEANDSEISQTQEPSDMHEDEGFVSNESNEEAMISARNDTLEDDANIDEVHADSNSDEALPVGWEEVADPSSGQIYYYNSESGETSWERPSGEDIVERKEQEPGQLPENAEKTDGIIVQDNPDNNDGDIGDGLPTGWEAVEDPSSGQIYYYNAESDETSWDRPKKVEDSYKEDTNIPPADLDENEGDSIPGTDSEVADTTDIDANDLPAGWEEVEDPSTGGIYYFHAESGETSWDRPKSEEGEAEVVSDTDDANVHHLDDDPIENTKKGDGDGDENVAEELPDGWEEVEDPSSGEIYFYHAESGETSWERPTAEDTQAEAPLEEDVDAPPVDNEISGGDECVVEELPDGWEEVEDPSSGEIYFYHAESGETSWERPTAEDTQAEAPLEEDAGAPSEGNDEDKTSGEANIKDMDDNENVAEELPDGWEEVEDPSSGEIYFYHAESGETSWERPIGTQNQLSQIEKEKSESNLAENDSCREDVDDEHDDAGVEVDLPEGWEEVEDSSSGNIYYYNAESGETSWEKPVVEISNDGQQDDDEEDGGDATEMRSDDAEPPAGENIDLNKDNDQNDLGALPEDWAEMKDPSSGEIYYYNSQSGETSWERPTMIEADVVSPASPLDDVGTELEPVDGADTQEDKAVNLCEPLPDGWVESEDSSSGEVYYYHSESGEVSWERPTIGLTNKLGPETSEEITFEPKKADDDGELLEGWVESADPSSGEVYYYHSESGEVSWERPTDGELAETDEKREISEKEYEDEQTDTDSGLPDGWIETEDPSNGEVYYYHAESGETSWERPTSIEEKKESLELSVVEEEEEDADQTNPIEAEANEDSSIPGPLPEFWVESKDPSSGETYYFNSLTQEVSWERPSVDESSKALDSKEGEADDNGDAISDDDNNECDDESTTSQAPPLPEDWVESTDPTSGETYYYNVKTEETSWERPEDSSTIESKESLPVNDVQQMNNEEKEASGEDDEPDDLVVENEGAEPSESELSSDWVEVEDPSGDKPYYYNPKTGETSWEKPEKAEANETHTEETDTAGQDQSPDPLVDDNGLLEGWVEVVDPASGDCYWYNHETQETTWDKPSKSMDAVGEVDANDADVNENIRDDWVDVDDDMPEKDIDIHEEQVNTNDQVAAELPDGWIESVDPSSGQIYYYNEMTNETSWDFPKESNSLSGSSGVATAANHDTSQGPDSTSIDGAGGSVSDIEDKRKKFSVFGPFTLCDDAVVTEYIMNKARSKDILWQLIAIAVQSKGRLRSDYGVVDKSGPEAAIVKLLLSSSDYVNHTKTSKNDIVIEEKIDDVVEGQDSIVKVQDLLIRGDRERAIEEAILIGDFATALLVASMCDPDTYKRVARKYAESKFRSDSPMYTTTMLFSGKIEAPSRRSSGNWGVKPEEMKKNWKSHLASIINNRTFGWDKIVLSLGDRLNEIGCIKEAHFCFMVCGYPITSPTDEETRVALLGCDHSNSKNRRLLTEESLVSFERTEAYEWAKRLGNQHAYFATFQPFKLIYAMLLADAGDRVQAQKFIQSIQISPDSARTASSGIKEVSFDQMFDDDVAFEVAYNEIEQQLTKGELQSKYKDTILMGGSLEITASKMQTAPTKSKSEEVRPVLQGRDQDQRFGAPNVDHRDPALDATFMTAKSNLMDVSGYTVDEKPISEPVSSPDATTKKNVSSSQPAKAEKRELLNEGPKEKEREQTKPATQPPKKQERPKAAPATAPAVMTGKKEEKAKPRTPAPASSGKPKQAPGSGAFGGMKSWIIKKLNPDAKEIHLPENEEQPYYDKDLKRWIFPGDDPAELAKPMAPPPMAIKKEADTPKEDAKPKDAVSSLMAPPPSRFSAKKRIPGAMSSPMMGMMMPPGGGPPGMMTPMGAGGSATPKFATFTPKAAVFTPKPSADTPAAEDGEEEPTK